MGLRRLGNGTMGAVTAPARLLRPELLVVGAGPAGSAAAIHAARAGYAVLLVDAASFPRDKTCGDGLTPRALSELRALGLAERVTGGYTNRGLILHGFGNSVTAPWPDSSYGTVGSAMPRTLFDALLLTTARAAGAEVWEDSPAVDVTVERGRARSVGIMHGGETVKVYPRWIIVADGVRSPLGRKLGRQWHRGEVYGLAARSYCASPRADEPWIHSHLQLSDAAGTPQPGYGWIFPLGNGTVNLGAGALSTDRHPARVNTKKLLAHYAHTQRAGWQLGPEDGVASAALPMGGAVSNVAGANWMLIGDAAACVNPLNGEGIDYGMETARLAVGLLGGPELFYRAWPALLRERYGQAFHLARAAARVIAIPGFLPAAGNVGLRGPLGHRLLPAAARLMGNLIDDADADLLARTWRLAGRAAATLAHAQNRPLWDTQPY